MKSQITRIALTAGLSITALVGGLKLSAQSKQTETVKIPFAFRVNHVSYSAGDYKVAEPMNGVFQIRPSNGAGTFLSAHPAADVGQNAVPHVTFACSGSDCVLAQILLPDSNTIYARSDSSVDGDHQRKLGMTAMVRVPFEH